MATPKLSCVAGTLASEKSKKRKKEKKKKKRQLRDNNN